MTETDAAMSNAEDDTYGKKNRFPWHRGSTEPDMIPSLDFVDGRTVLPLYGRLNPEFWNSRARSTSDSCA